MKSILYRAKAINRNPNINYRTDYQNGDWVYGLVSKLYKYDDKYFAEMTNTDGVSGIDVDPETICEYTGLTDKSGKQIFEGDILSDRLSDCLSLVKFEECRFKIENSCGVEIKTTQKAVDWFGFEIIGNIYDNTELLRED